jgi:ribonuclease P protein component
MLPFKNRLPYLDYLQTKQKGKLLKFVFGKIIYTKKPNSTNSRFLIKVGAKSVKLSTKRNRIKRITREAIRKIVSNLCTNIDAIIMIKSVAENKKTQDMQQELEKVFKKERLLK